MKKKKPLIIFHQPCPDGFGAAYSAWLVFGSSAEYLGADHGSYPKPDVRGRLVYVLDFSFPRDQLQEMQALAAKLVLLDHHKTAEASLAGLPGIIFDTEKSGSRLAWEHFHPSKPFPQVLEFVEDRDLKRWAIVGSADFLAYLDAQPLDFKHWHKIIESGDEAICTYQAAGAAMERKMASMARMLADLSEPVRIQGILGAKVNASYLCSDAIGTELYTRTGTFALIWRIANGLLYVSLRSALGSTDVADIASLFGGGGHSFSAAFRLQVGTPAFDHFMNTYIYQEGRESPPPL